MNEEVVMAIESVDEARKESENNMHAGLEVANFRAKEIQMEYEASFLKKKEKAIKELNALQTRLSQQNIASDQ